MRRLLLVLVPVFALALAATLLTAAAPASAATFDEFRIVGPTEDLVVPAGADLTAEISFTPETRDSNVTFTPAGTAVGVVRGWDARSFPSYVTTRYLTIPSSTEPGTTFTFQLISTEGNITRESEVITVTVVEGPITVTPTAAVVDDCELIIPDTVGVQYQFQYEFIDWYGVPSTSFERIAPGRYPALDYAQPSSGRIYVVAWARSGYDLTPGESARLDTTLDDGCRPDRVTAHIINAAGFPVVGTQVSLYEWVPNGNGGWSGAWTHSQTDVRGEASFHAAPGTKVALYTSSQGYVEKNVPGPGRPGSSTVPTASNSRTVGTNGYDFGTIRVEAYRPLVTGTLIGSPEFTFSVGFYKWDSTTNTWIHTISARLDDEGRYSAPLEPGQRYSWFFAGDPDRYPVYAAFAGKRYLPSRATSLNSFVVPSSGVIDLGTTLLDGWPITADTAPARPAGAANPGQTLRTTPVTWTARDQAARDAATHYQWLADDVVIPGANAATYTVRQSDLGKNISVRHSASSAALSTGTGTTLSQAVRITSGTYTNVTANAPYRYATLGGNKRLDVWYGGRDGQRIAGRVEVTTRSSTGQTRTASYWYDGRGRHVWTHRFTQTGTHQVTTTFTPANPAYASSVVSYSLWVNRG